MSGETKALFQFLRRVYAWALCAVFGHVPGYARGHRICVRCDRRLA